MTEHEMEMEVARRLHALLRKVDRFILLMFAIAAVCFGLMAIL